ncbi:hypothetical protein C4J81_13775 [Deltaproteobacteria bacterium Smac51]|nr:hypothetical protein C4J81_13775 [Deltaproteobacteria bacterium Smac51]
MPWKTNENSGLAVNDHGNPIWVSDTGEEKVVDYTAMSAALSRANREAAERNDKIKALDAKLAPLADIEDFDNWREEALKAIETVRGLPDKDKAIEERIKAQVDAATKPLRDQVATMEKQRREAEEHLQRETVSNAFNRSEFVRGKMVDPIVAADLFSKHFSLNQDGRLIATGHDGQIIYGENGEAAFDEALAKLVDGYPGKNYLLKGSSASGSGANPGSSGKPGGSNPKSLSDCKTEAEKIQYLKDQTGNNP